MTPFNRTNHWENIYLTKLITGCSWHQEFPATSLKFIISAQPELLCDAHIIDIGGGDSKLADHLHGLGYTEITVLDISATALQHAQKRLGNKADCIKWIHADVTEFKPAQQYDIWHDRAAFHFLTQPHEVEKYIAIASKSIRQGGALIVATFSHQGPAKCSGIDVRQYDADELSSLFAPHFTLIEHQYVDHITPSDAVQNFTYCVFKKM